MTEPKTDGQVITFYSYKGGTGRSMALTNVACLIARGVSMLEGDSVAMPKRVLAVDWDLEAPGLHRFFSSLLMADSGPAGENPENSEGLIDLLSRLEEVTRDWVPSEGSNQ